MGITEMLDFPVETIARLIHRLDAETSELAEASAVNRFFASFDKMAETHGRIRTGNLSLRVA